MQQNSTTKSSVVLQEKKKINILEKLSFAWTIISVLYSTGFMIFGILSKWGNSRYTYILLGIISAYILVFVSIISIKALRDKKRQQLDSLEIEQNEKDLSLIQTNQIANISKKTKSPQSIKSTKKVLKNYKGGMAILKALTNLLYVVMTITLMCSAASMSGTSGAVAWVSIIVSLFLALLTLSLKIAVFVLKKMLPKIAKKGTYKVYEVIDGRVKEKSKTNKLIAAFANKLKKQDDDK